MKKRLFVNKKCGFTFIEVLISILIIGFISISFYYGITIYNKNLIKSKNTFEKEKIITTTYETLSFNPYLFKERICYCFNGLWEIGTPDGTFNVKDSFKLDNYNYTIKHYEDYAEIKVEIYEGDELIQSWIRAKTGIY